MSTQVGREVDRLTIFCGEIGGVGDGDDVAGEHGSAGRFAVVGDTVSFPATNPNGDLIQLAPPAVPPVGFPAIQSPTGLQVGDLILLTNNIGSAVGEVTGIAFGHEHNITFANLDP